MEARKRFQFKTSQGRYGKRHKPGQMNRTEEAYAKILEARKQSGEIIEWHFEAVTLKLAENCRHTLDFTVLYADGRFEFVNVKGGGPINETSRVKARMAAEKFWMFSFAEEQKLSKKAAAEHGGEWKRTEY